MEQLFLARHAANVAGIETLQEDFLCDCCSAEQSFLFVMGQGRRLKVHSSIYYNLTKINFANKDIAM